MANIGYATLSVVPSMRGFGARLRTGLSGPLSTEGAAAGETTGKSFASTFAKVAIAGTAAIGAIHIGKSFVEAAVESQKVSQQTEAVLKSMGQVAGLTADDVGKLSEKLSLQSGIDDELIQNAANVLLTFGQVRNEVGKGNDVFNRASQAALDMSVALKQDLQGATIQVGKALNDPIKGITALSRAGVSFTQQQKDQIKTLAESGHSLEAQKIILSELEKQFGGSAKAQATAGERLKVAIGNIQETIGAALLPVVEKVAGFLADKLPVALEALGRLLGPVFRQIGLGFRALGAAFKDPDVTSDGFVGVMERIGVAARAFVEWFKRNWPQIKAIGTAVLKVLGTALEKIAKVVGKVLVPAVVKLGKWVVEHKPVLIGLAVAIGVGLVSAFVAWATAAATAAAATIVAAAPVIAIGAAIAALVAGIIYAYENWDVFRETVQAVGRFLKDTLWPILKNIFGWIKDTLIPIVLDVIEAWVDFHIAVFRIVREIAEKIAGFVTDVFGFFDGLVDFMVKLPGRVLGAADAMWDFLWEQAESIIGSIVGGFEAVIDWFRDLGDKIKEAVGSGFDVLYQFGAEMVQGLIQGMIDMASKIPGATTALDIALGIGGASPVSPEDLARLGLDPQGRPVSEPGEFQSRLTEGKGLNRRFVGRAMGGPIYGPAGLDRVPIWATAGEFVMRKRAVEKLGLPFLKFLNAGGFSGPDVPWGDRAMAPGRYTEPAGNWSGGDQITLQVIQYPGEDQISAGMRALEWHRHKKTALAVR